MNTPQPTSPIVIPFPHVFSRGNERRDIFTDNDDRISFLEILGEMSEGFGVEVYAYVLVNTKSSFMVLLCKNFFFQKVFVCHKKLKVSKV